MKTLCVLLMITGISLCSFAQNEKPFNDFQKIDFNKDWQKDTTDYFTISPEFKPDTVFHEFQYSQKLNNEPFQINESNSLFTFENSAKYEFRMPIAKGGKHFNMPNAVPDSTVHYYIKEKRIQFVNPLKYEYK